MLDLACDRGHFIRFVERPRAVGDRHPGRAARPCRRRSVSCRRPGCELAKVLPTGHFGTVFMSNYLEHLESGDAVIEQLRGRPALLRPGGRVVVLQPNIRLVGPRYWDFIDHRVALTERSLLEAAELAGLGTVKLVRGSCRTRPRAGCRATRAWSALYLAFPPAWRLMGRQTLYVGERRA